MKSPSRRFLIGLLLSAVGVWFAFRGARWGDVGRAVSHLSNPLALLLIPLAGLVEYALRTERWRLMTGISPTGRFALFPIVAGSFFINNVLPFRAGEAARVYWTHREKGRPLGEVVGALALDRAADVAALALLTLLLVAVAPQTGLLSGRSALILLCAAVIGTGLLLILGRDSFSTIRKRWLPESAQRFLLGLSTAATALGRPGVLTRTILLSAGVWALNVALDRAIADLFGLDLSWAESGWFLVALAAGVALPSSPGYIGTFEAAGVGALVLLGRDPVVSLSFVVVLHAGQIFGSAIWGGPGLWRRGRPGAGAAPANVIKSAP